jgi:hypothetical protein
MNCRNSLLRFSSLSVVALALASPVWADRLVSRWQLATGDRDYLDAANTLRGLAFDPVGKFVVATPRAGLPRVIALDGASGADGTETGGELRQLLFTDALGEGIVTGGTFPINLVGTGADGAVYVANLITSSAGQLRIYRWSKADPVEAVSLAYAGTVGLDLNLNIGTANDGRFGDAFAVRGSGNSTELLFSARTGKYLLVFRTTDGLEFTPTAYATDIPANGAGLGIAWGQGNTVWTKSAGQSLRRLELVEATKTARTLNTFTGTVIPGSVGPIATDAAAQRLAAVDTSGHTLRVYDISNPASLVAVGDPLPFPGAVANGNGTGAAAFDGNQVFALDTNNGILAATVEVELEAPSVVTPPAGGAPYVGTPFTFAVSAKGSAPLTYQWFFNDAPLDGETGPSLSLSSVTLARSGSYTVRIKNGAGEVTSVGATLNVREPFTTSVLTPLWSVLAGQRDTINNDSTQRGLAFNPVTGNVLYVSRTGGNRIVVVDGATGAEKHTLSTTDADGVNVVGGGTLPVNLIAVAADGAVFVANLDLPASADAPAVLRVYRWESDAPDQGPTLFTIDGLPNGVRFGDTLAVRGQGDTTDLVFGSRSAKSFAVTRVTAAGSLAETKVYQAADVADGAFGLGLTFGPGDSIYGTASGSPVVHVGFDAAAGTATLVRTYAGARIPTAVAHLAYDPVKNLLAGTALETPDNVLLYNLADIESPILLDQELFPLDNPNINGTGALAFGRNRLYVLDSNQGLFAYTLNLNPAVATRLKAELSGDSVKISTPDAGTFEVEQATTLGGAWVKVGTLTAAQPFVVPAALPGAVFRAVAR